MTDNKNLCEMVKRLNNIFRVENLPVYETKEEVEKWRRVYLRFMFGNYHPRTKSSRRRKDDI